MPAGLFDLLSIQGVTHPSSNVTSEAVIGFELKDKRNTAYLRITDATFDTDAYFSLALSPGSTEVSAANAKKLPGVTAGETIVVYCELFVDTLAAGRSAGFEIAFFNDSGVQQGVTQNIAIEEADTWEQKKALLTVPSGATRVNFRLHVGCEPTQTIQAWIAALRLKR